MTAPEFEKRCELSFHLHHRRLVHTVFRAHRSDIVMVNEYTPILGTSGLGLSMCTIPTLVGRKKLPSNFAKKPFYLETTGPCHVVIDDRHSSSIVVNHVTSPHLGSMYIHAIM